MNILQLLLGQIPEAIFYSLFMLFAKNLKTKRIRFTLILILEYLLCKYAFPFSWMFHIFYIISVFITLKVFYKERSQITDIFIFAISYILVIITSILCFVVCNKNVIIATIMNRIVLFVPLFIYKKDLYKIQLLYKKYWNRNDKIKKKMKSVTFRSLNIVIFNLLFYIINSLMVFAVYYNFTH